MATSGAVNCVGVTHEFPTDLVDTSEEKLNSIVDANAATLRITILVASAMVSRYISHFPQLPRIGRRPCCAPSYGKMGTGSFAGTSPIPMFAICYSGSSFGLGPMRSLLS